jgi:hypothetical protein
MSTTQIQTSYTCLKICANDLGVTFQQDLWLAIQVELVKRTLYV